MARRRSCTLEQIIIKLRDAEILLGQGKTVKEASTLMEISKQTYYCDLTVIFSLPIVLFHKNISRSLFGRQEKDYWQTLKEGEEVLKQVQSSSPVSFCWMLWGSFI